MHYLGRRMPSVEVFPVDAAFSPSSEDSWSVDSGQSQRRFTTKWTEDEKMCLAKSVVDRFCKRGSLNSSRETNVHECWDEIKRDFDENYQLIKGSAPAYERSAKSIRRYYKEMKKSFRTKQTFLHHYLEQWKKKNYVTLDRIAQEPPTFIRKNIDAISNKKWQYEEDVILAGAVMLRFLKTGSLANTPDNCWEYIKNVFDEKFDDIFRQKPFPRESEEFYKRFKLMREKVQRLQGKSSYFLDLYNKYESWSSYRAMQGTRTSKKRCRGQVERDISSQKRHKFVKQEPYSCFISEIEEAFVNELSEDFPIVDCGLSKDVKKAPRSEFGFPVDINVFWEDDFVLVLSDMLSQTF